MNAVCHELVLGDGLVCALFDGSSGNPLYDGEPVDVLVRVDGRSDHEPVGDVWEPADGQLDPVAYLHELSCSDFGACGPLDVLAHEGVDVFGPFGDGSSYGPTLRGVRASLLVICHVYDHVSYVCELLDLVALRSSPR